MSNATEKITALITLALLMINIVPPLFRDNELYFDNAYNTVLYFSLSFIAIALPWITKMYRIIKIICLGVGGWFTSALAFEAFNWFVPDVVFNTMDDDFLYLQWVICFVIAISFIITHEVWIKQKR